MDYKSELQNGFCHYGTLEKSGAHPWGSGKRPYQRLEGTAEYKRLMKQKSATSGSASTVKSNTHDRPATIHDTEKEKNAAKLEKAKLDRMIASANRNNAWAKAYLQEREASLAHAAEKMKADDKRRSKLKVDEATGFHLRNGNQDERDFRKELRNPENKMVSSELVKMQADAKKVNPGISDYDSGTTNNCCLCTITNEMRQRGYDVRAKKLSAGMSWEQIRKVFPGGRESYIPRTMENSAEWTAAQSYSNKAINDRINKTLSKEPEGSRGLLNIHYTDYSGHAISYEIRHGQPIYTDAQVARSFNSKSSMDYFGGVVTCSYLRLDDRVPNLKKLKEVCE